MFASDEKVSDHADDGQENNGGYPKKFFSDRGKVMGDGMDDGPNPENGEDDA